MMFLYFFIFLCAVLLQGSYGDSNLQDRIAGGSSTAIENHPYQVYFECSLFDNGQFKKSQCGGSIISTRHILTAAHCVKKRALSSHVRAGSTWSETGGTMYTVKQMVAHPQYNPDTDDYDVALLILESRIYFDGKTTKVIGLPPLGASLQPGTDVVVTGWGYTSTSSPAENQKLMEVTVPMISKKDCRPIWARKGRDITPSASGRQGDACRGDSGGPAVDKATGVQIGVVSWGYKKCRKSRYPGVYTDLTNHEIRKWINRTIGV